MNAVFLVSTTSGVKVCRVVNEGILRCLLVTGPNWSGVSRITCKSRLPVLSVTNVKLSCHRPEHILGLMSHRNDDG